MHLCLTLPQVPGNRCIGYHPAPVGDGESLERLHLWGVHGSGQGPAVSAALPALRNHRGHHLRPWAQPSLGLPSGSCPDVQSGPCRKTCLQAAMPPERSPPVVTKNRSPGSSHLSRFISCSLSLGDIYGEMSINSASGGCALGGRPCPWEEDLCLLQRSAVSGDQEPPVGAAFPCVACLGTYRQQLGRGQPEDAPVPASLTARAASCPPPDHGHHRGPLLAGPQSLVHLECQLCG